MVATGETMQNAALPVVRYEGLKRAIDEDLVPVPRIWPSGAMISQTSGHGDYRSFHDLTRDNTSEPYFIE
jgi:hypothetical protein